MSLYHFARWFEIEGAKKNEFRQPEEIDDDGRDDVDDDGVPMPKFCFNPPNTFITPNPEYDTLMKSVPPFCLYTDGGDGQPHQKLKRQPRWKYGNKVIRQRVTPKHISTPRHDTVPSAESMYSLMVLHVPNRKEPFDLVGVDSAEEMSFKDMAIVFAKHKTTIGKDSKLGNDRYLRSVERAMTHLEMPEHFQSVYNFISPDHSHGRSQDSDYINEEGASVENFNPDQLHYDDDIPCNNDAVNDGDVAALPLQLDADQQRTVNVIRTYCTALINASKSDFIAPPHIFLTGPAGTGKSATIFAVIDVVKDYSDTMASRTVIRHGAIYVTASTGAAAQQFDGGQTVHTAAGLKPDKRLRRITCLDSFIDKMDSTQLQKLQDDWQGVILMIIDEVSMVSANMLYALHMRLNLIFGKQNQPGVYFGGIGIILVGDLYQLKPVLASYVFEDLENSSLNLFRLLFHPIFLTTIHRQKRDLPFMHLLSRVRVGEQTDEDYEFLSSLHVSVNKKKYETQYETVSHLFPTKKLTHEHNISRVPSNQQKVLLFNPNNSNNLNNPNHPNNPIKTLITLITLITNPE